MLVDFFLFDFILLFPDFICVSLFLFEILLCLDPLLLVSISEHHDLFGLLRVVHDPLSLSLDQLIKISLECA